MTPPDAPIVTELYQLGRLKKDTEMWCLLDRESPDDGILLGLTWPEWLSLARAILEREAANDRASGKSRGFADPGPVFGLEAIK